MDPTSAGGRWRPHSAQIHRINKPGKPTRWHPSPMTITAPRLHHRPQTAMPYDPNCRSNCSSAASYSRIFAERPQSAQSVRRAERPQSAQSVRKAERPQSAQSVRRADLNIPLEDRTFQAARELLEKKPQPSVRDDSPIKHLPVRPTSAPPGRASHATQTSAVESHDKIRPTTAKPRPKEEGEFVPAVSSSAHAREPDPMPDRSTPVPQYAPAERCADQDPRAMGLADNSAEDYYSTCVFKLGENSRPECISLWRVQRMGSR